MSTYKITVPAMGEGIIEVTLIRWLKNIGDIVEIDDPIAEVATDKVDSEIPSPVKGIIKELKFEEGDIAPVGEIMAILEVEGEGNDEVEIKEIETEIKELEPNITEETPEIDSDNDPSTKGFKYFSPLVRNIAKVENISVQELDKIAGSGKDGRLTKEDLDKYLLERSKVKDEKASAAPIQKTETTSAAPVTKMSGDRVEEMSRMRKLIADHMVQSVHTSPHVTSFIEVNMSAVVKWRDKNKAEFLSKDNEKLTYTHIITEVVSKALQEFPGINTSVDGNSIVYRKNINIGLATVLPDGNLIVPVIKNVDEKSLSGIVRSVNDTVNRARNNALKPDEIQGGTFTITNLGGFDTIIGTPIINQPQAAILAVGAIRKQVVVVEGEQGDSIGIAPMMYMALTYDHRIVDGAMGGLFIKRIKELLENYK